MTQIDADERVRRRIESRVRRYMDNEALWPADGHLLVAVSGGPDSSTLLTVLKRLAHGQTGNRSDQRRPLQLTAAYFDHQLRGDEAARKERDAVDALCERLAVPLICGAVDVRAEARRSKRSLEDAARRARYAFLAPAARETGCRAVATGHTASDQAETVLLNLVRGVGLSGLAGIAPSGPWPFPAAGTPRLIRPLLCLSREETAAYCTAAGIEPVEDESNTSPDFRRNRVRHEVLPLLRSLNPRVDAALVRLADASREDASYLEAAAASLVRFNGDEARLAREDFTALSRSLRVQALRAALRGVLGDLDGLAARHLGALDRLVIQGRTGDRVDLPRGIVASLTRDALLFATRVIEAQALPECSVRLPVPGAAQFGSLVVEAGVEAPEGAIAVTLDAEAVGNMLFVRRRRDGDRIQPLGMTGTKKLQDLFVDTHIPREQRNAVPIFENERGIVWVGGVRVAEWARARPGEPVVTLSYRLVSS